MASCPKDTLGDPSLDNIYSERRRQTPIPTPNSKFSGRQENLPEMWNNKEMCPEVEFIFPPRILIGDVRRLLEEAMHLESQLKQSKKQIEILRDEKQRQSYIDYRTA
eukprot:SAG22_NODE_10317_length_541_cov_1.540724_1_plen_107_part_00